MHEAHSRQNSSVQDVTQAVSRTIYGHETTSWIFLPRFSIFFIPFGNTKVDILFYFRELLDERRIDGTSEQMSYHFFGFASNRACFWPSFDVFDSERSLVKNLKV